MKKELKYPDFLGIGAQRAGTTWLYDKLSRHPGIWIGLKEVHYFDRSPKYPSPSFLAADSIYLRFFGQGIEYKQFRKRIMGIFNLALLLQNPYGYLSRWYQLFSWKFDDQWYASLFKNGSGKVTGELTPSYSMLDRHDIEHISQIMPKVKIIFFMRNPIDRAWSHFKYSYAAKRRIPIQLIPEEQIMAHFNSPTFLLRGDYLRTYNNWNAYFPKEQIFVGFFDEIKDNPEGLLLRLYKFLGVDSSVSFIPKNLQKKVNTSSIVPLPLKLKKYLAGLYYSQTKKLSEMFGGYAVLWYKEMEEILQINEV